MLQTAYDEQLPSTAGLMCQHAMGTKPRSTTYRLNNASLDGSLLELAFSDRDHPADHVRFFGRIDDLYIVGSYHFEAAPDVYVPLTLVQEKAPEPPDGSPTPCPTARPK